MIQELKDFIFELLFLILKFLCYLIDFIKEVFYKLGGVETVDFGDKKGELLFHFVTESKISLAFYMALLIGVILLFVFSIIAILKSEKGVNKITKGEIVFKMFRAFTLIITMPFVIYAFIYVSNQILISLNNGMNEYLILDRGSSISLGGEIFVVSSFDAYSYDENLRDFIESKFISGELSYMDISEVRKYYDISEINYVVGILSSITILLMFAKTTISFIQRIFDVVLLYIISPVAIATIPLDEDYRFNNFKDILISKILYQYGIILSMNLFLLIIPEINEISFFANEFKDGVIHILFLIGGAYAVVNASSVINRITHSDQVNPSELIGSLNLTKAAAVSAATTSSSFIKKEIKSKEVKDGEKGINMKNEKLENIIKGNNGKNNK